MRLIFLGLFTLSAFELSAHTLLSADNKSCGPYLYKTTTNEIKQLRVFALNETSKGYIISNEMPRLKSFLDGWLLFFGGNGEIQLQNKNLCYGYYDDASSTGANAQAFGDQAILIGTQMMSDIRTGIDNFVKNKVQQYAPGKPRSTITFQASAAFDFVLFHEMAHTLQNTHRMTFSGSTEKQKELHADCSGAFMFTMSRILRNQYSADDTLAGMMYAYALGDSDTLSSTHHGFPEERMNAFSIGMSGAINLKGKGFDLKKTKSKEIMGFCSQSFR